LAVAYSGADGRTSVPSSDCASVDQAAGSRVSVVVGDTDGRVVVDLAPCALGLPAHPARDPKTPVDAVAATTMAA
jgi:hypothetical protein